MLSFINLKMASISKAAEVTKVKRKPKKSIKEKFEDSFWNFFREVGQSFNIFKDKSPLQIVSIVVILLLGIVFYINYFSPVIALGRNMLILYPEITTLEENINKGHFGSIKNNLETITFHFDDTKKIFFQI